MIALQICVVVAIYAAFRVVFEKNTLRKLPFLNVVSFAVSGIIVLIIPQPLALLAAGAYLLGTALGSNAIASTLAGDEEG